MAKQRYRIVEKIDMGGMAEIYRGRSVTLEGIEKEVAIKRVLPQLTKNRKFVAMFLDEARLSMHLNHANIVQVFDVGKADHTYFIVMEFVDGYNLRKIFQRATETNTNIPVEIAVYMMMQVCNALGHAHDKRDSEGDPLNIVHRDVSPPNVLISKAGEVKLTDFGLAKAVSQLEVTDPGIVKGKFSYLAPETAAGLDVDHRADIFAMGIILFELLTNRRLFLGGTDVETVELVEKAEVPSVSRLNSDVPRELEKILVRALERDPRKRFASAQECSDRLAEWLFGANLKVTPFDLASFLRRLFDDAPSEDAGERIDKMIADEILNLSMLGMGPDALGANGSQPLRAEDLNLDLKLAGRIPLHELWPSKPEGVELELVNGFDDETNESAGHSIWMGVGIGAGIFAAMMAVYYYWVQFGGGG
jgi:serine/threonine protein kinase